MYPDQNGTLLLWQEYDVMVIEIRLRFARTYEKYFV
jgi:hypothetical protein